MSTRGEDPRRNDPVRIVEQLRQLQRQSTRELGDRWQCEMGIPPPPELSRDLLLRAMADRLQEAALGGLPLAAKRRLAALARSVEKDIGAATASPMLRLKPGSKLVRAWRGKTHSVLVLDEGFEHLGKRYTSLTQIAREITGAHWSGPRFFGLSPAQPASSKKVGDGAP